MSSNEGGRDSGAFGVVGGGVPETNNTRRGGSGRSRTQPTLPLLSTCSMFVDWVAREESDEREVKEAAVGKRVSVLDA